MEVYADILFLLNFLVDFLLLVGTNRLSGHGMGIRRALPAGLIGGAYAVACLLPGFTFLGNTLWRLVCLAGMSTVAFGLSESGLRRGILFVLLSMALGGIAVGLGNGGFWALVLSAGCVCGLCILGFRGRVTGQRYVPVSVTVGGKTVELTALLDTGNTLRDPISGKPVLVVEESAAEKLCPLTPSQLAHPIETMASSKLPGLRLIPFRAVGSKAGMLLGIRPDCVRVDGKEQAYIVAFVPQSLGHGRYQALAGGAL